MSAYSDAIIALSPTGYWRLGESSGNLVDVVAARNLTVTGAPTYGVAGALDDNDTAIEFSGSAQYATGPADFPTPTTGISVVSWFKTTDATAAARAVSGRSFTNQHSWALRLTAVHAASFSAFQSAGTNHAAATSSLTYNDGLWHLAVGTFDGTTIRLYIDGAEVTSSTSLTGTWHTASTVAPVVGAQTTAGVNAFPGSLDEPAIFNDIILTAPQIATLWAAISYLPGFATSSVSSAGATVTLNGIAQ